MNGESDRIQKFLLRDDGTFPNHPNWPLLIYRSAFSLSSDDPAGSIEQLFEQNDWGGTWRNGIYSFHHYHSNAHEVLGVFSGSARVRFGGPHGVEMELQAGDVAVLPAGTAHRNLGARGNFGVIGGYPGGTDYDMCYGREEERTKAIERIRNVTRPATDPVFGREAGLRVHWPAHPGTL